MLFFKKQEKEEISVQKAESIDTYPILHVADSLKGYQKQMLQKEVKSLEVLREMQLAFQEVMQENTTSMDKLNNFENDFGSVEQVSAQFVKVKDDITESVEQNVFL